MADAAKSAAAHVLAFAHDMLRQRADALGAGGAPLLLHKLKTAESVKAVRSALGELFDRLSLSRTVDIAFLEFGWTTRCDAAPGADALINLTNELRDAVPDVAPPATEAYGGKREDGASGSGAGTAADARVAQLEAQVRALLLQNKSLVGQNKRLSAELAKASSGAQGGHRSGAATEPIDLCGPSESDEESERDSDDDSVIITEGGEAAESVDAPPQLAPLAHELKLSSVKREPKREAPAAAPAAPRPKKRRSGLGNREAPATDRGRGMRCVASLMTALLKQPGKLPTAASQLHMLGDHKGVTLLHAAACSDANAGMVALILAHAATDGPAALQAALRRPSDAGAHNSPFATPPRGDAPAPPPRLAAGATALHYAALHGAVECACLLVQAGADVAAHGAAMHGSEGSACALDLAAARGNCGVLRLLLRAGADVNARSAPHGWAALHWAAEFGRTDAVRLLLLHGAQPDAADAKGLTAIVWALKSENGCHAKGGSAPVSADCHDERVSVLVELCYAGAKAGLPDRADEPITRVDYGRSLLHACAGGLTLNSLPLLRRLLACEDIDVNAGAGELGSPLDLAVHAGWAEGALLLLNKGADPNSRDVAGSTPLMRAASLRPGLGGSDLVRLCFHKGADAAATDARGRTPAHYAALHGRVDALRTLRALGADLTARDADGLTPANLAAAHHAGSTLAALRAVISAPVCPARTLKPGEDAACDLEDVAIVADAAVVLPEDLSFITSNVEAPGMVLSAPDRTGAAASCCECTMCVPGVCPCLKSSALVSAAAALAEPAVDDLLAGEAAHALEKGLPSGGPVRAVAELLRGDTPFVCFATGLQLALGGPGAARFKSDGARALPVVGAAAALLSLRLLLAELPGLSTDAVDVELAQGYTRWNDRVRCAPKAKTEAAACEELAGLLLQLEDAMAAAAAALLEHEQQHAVRGVPVWQARQAAAWLAEARPCWRAAARQGRNGAPPTPPALAASMRQLLLALRSISTPLRVAPAASGIPLVRLCSPRCLCAAGGCRAVGVQFLLSLRDSVGCGLGAHAACDVPCGALVAPYVGEVTTQTAADAAAQGHADGGAPQRHYYSLDLATKHWLHQSSKTEGFAVVDAARFGNVARFFNHACKPNLERVAVDWPGLEAGPLMFLYAREELAAGTALCWDYFSGERRSWKMGFKCACSAACREKR